MAMLIPACASAATIAPPRDLKGFVSLISDLIALLIVFVFALTFLTVVWGVIKGWVVGGGDTEGVEQGKKVIFAGIIGLVIMSSIWGILYLLRASFFGS